MVKDVCVNDRHRQPYSINVHNRSFVEDSAISGHGAAEVSLDTWICRH